jgi:hypothetical protein
VDLQPTARIFRVKESRMYETINLGGASPMGTRARGRWRARMRNVVRKVPTFGGGARLASGSFQRGGGGGGRRHPGRHRHGGFVPTYYSWNYPYYYPYYTYYPYLYPYAWYQPYYYPTSYPTYSAPSYTETVPASCCYDQQSGTLYCPGSQYDGAPAYAEATREYQGRLMSFVTSPRLGQAQWFWNCPPDSPAPSRSAPNRSGRTYLRAA